MERKNTKQFIVWECQSSISTDGRLVRLVFKDEDDNEREVVFNRDSLPSLIVQLQSKTVPGSGRPIDRSELMPGDNFSVAGFRVNKISDGGCLLIVSLRLFSPERLVEIPLNFTPKDLEVLFSMIIGEKESLTH